MHITEFSLKHKKAVFVAAAAVSALAAVGALQLQTKTGYRTYLGGSNPIVRRLDRFIADFGGGLPVQVAWTCAPSDPCHSALDPSFLLAARRIAKAVETVPGVEHVYTPGTTPLLVSHAGEIATRTLLDHGRPASDFADLAVAARKDPLWRGLLVSPDGRTAALVVELESSDSRLETEAVHTLLRAIQAEAPRHYALVGNSIDFVVGDRSLDKEGKTLGGVALLLVAATIWILFRKPLVILPAVTTVGLAALWTLGLMGWMRWPETAVSQTLVPLLLVVGICDGIHLLSRYRDLPEEVPELASLPRAKRLNRAARDVGWACVLTSVTTAAGVGSFVTSDLASFVYFGVAAAAGVMFALLITFTVMPILVDGLKIELPKRATSLGWIRALDVLAGATERHALAIVVGSVVLLSLAGWGVSRLRVDVSDVSLYGSTSPIVRWRRWMAEHIRRPDTLEVRLSLPKGTSVADPSALGVLERFRSFLGTQPHFGPVRSILDPLGRMNELLHEDNPAMDRPGTTREQNEQLLLMLSSTDRNFVTSWVTPDRRHARLSVEADFLSKNERERLLAAVGAYLDRALPPGWSYEFTGPLAVFQQMDTAMQGTQLRSFAVAAVVIPLLVAFGLRSLVAGAWIVVPTALPIALTLGAMGFLGIDLDTGTAMIAAVLLGIAVDDGIHLVSRYREHRKVGRGRSESMHESLREVGRAVVATSLILAAGFLAMVLSSWGSIASFGFLSACAILLALLADLFLLPAIVFLRARGEPRDGKRAMDVRPAKPRMRARAAGILLSVAAVVFLLGQVTNEVVSSKATSRPLCQPLENGVVALSAALVPGCPLRAFELARPVAAEGSAAGRASSSPVRFAVDRGGLESRVSVPRIADPPKERLQAVLLVSVVSFFFLGICFVILWGSPAPAAVPLVVGATAAVAVASGVTLGSWSPTASRAAAVGVTVLPAALTHLALTFPTERPLLRASSRFLLLLYVPTAIVAALVLWTYFSLPELFRALFQLLLFLTVVAAIALFAGSVSGFRSSPFALHRARARILLSTLAGVVATVAVLLATPVAWMASIPGGRPGALALTMLVALVPLARTVRRVHAVHLPVKAAILLCLGAQGASFVGLAFVVNALLPTSWDGTVHTLATAAIAWLGVAVLELTFWGPLRFQSARRAEKRSSLGLVHASGIHAFSALGELADALRRTVDVAVRPRFLTVFLRGPSGWFPAALSPSGPTDEGLAAVASEVVSSGRTVYLADEAEGRAEGAEMLRQAGVETVVPLGDAAARRGVAILGRAPEPLGRRDLEFLDTLAAQTATGLAWLDTAEDLAQTRALAQGGFLAASLTHDLGKPLCNIWAVARSALKPERTWDEVRERLVEIQEFSDRGLAVIDRLFARMKARAADRRAKPLGEVITLACQAAEQRHRMRIQTFFPAEMPEVEGDFEIAQALSALLDNACREPRNGIPVVVSVTLLTGGGTQIDVSDSGSGMDEETKARAFEPWFTRQAGQGGRGLGLALARLLVRQLGGDIEIVESELGKGTRMRLLLPASIRKALVAERASAPATSLSGNVVVRLH